MVQLQAFTTNDYLLKINCFDNNKLQNRRKKWEIIIKFFWISKNIISKFSRRPLIGQNDPVNVLLLDAFFLWLKKGRNELTHTFGC